MAHQNRRVFLQTSACATVTSAFSLYPQPAQAWIWMIGRAILAFTGRSVGARVARGVAGTVSRPVASRATRYGTRVRPYYPQTQRDDSYRFAEFVGRELGQYGAESAFDYVYNLNQSHHGGTRQIFMRGEDENEGGVGFSTGDLNRQITDFHASHVTALDTCSQRLQIMGFTAAEIIGLLYPTSGLQNNLSSSGYRRTGRVSFRTAFGHVNINTYHINPLAVRGDVFAQDEVTDRYFRWDGVIA